MAADTSSTSVVIGVDVGGTNTDAVILDIKADKPVVLSSAKATTTSDVTDGVCMSIVRAISKYFSAGNSNLSIQQVNIGTTHFVNALVQRVNLTKVSVIRLCGPASRSIPPFSDFNSALRDTIDGGVYYVNGGFEFNGIDISPINTEEILRTVSECTSRGINHFVICGIFATVKPEQEIKVRDIILEGNNELSVTMSHTIGQIGLLERENASILNECLKPLCMKTIEGLSRALEELCLECPLFLTQNDGTVLDKEAARMRPVFMLASGPTNSMRGASFLSGTKEAIVVDIGGTTTDVGVLHNGFPRVASTEVKVGGIRTNFQMPDILSIGLGGGSYVTCSSSPNQTKVGPRSAGYNIINEALVFGPEVELERCVTATDVAVASGVCDIGNKDNVKHLDSQLVSSAMDRMHVMIESAIDQMKTSMGDTDIVLVGGGSVLVDLSRDLKGVRNIVKIPHADVANAVGAAISQVSGSVDYVVSLTEYVDMDKVRSVVDTFKSSPASVTTEDVERTERDAIKDQLEKARETVLATAQEEAKTDAIHRGAAPDTICIVEKGDTPLAYLPGNATRVQVKCIGDLKHTDSRGASLTGTPPTYTEILKRVQQFRSAKQHMTATGGNVEEENVNTSPQDLQQTVVNGEWVISTYDIECIGIGAGILGCGGGGSPYLGKLLAKQTLQQGKVIRVISPETLRKTSNPNLDVILPVAMMGAPLIIHEKLKSQETVSAIKCLQCLYHDERYRGGEWNGTALDVTTTENDCISIPHYEKLICNASESVDGSVGNKNIVALTCAEIGGMNAIEPLIVAAEMGIPVLDADGMGRAFPELQMYAPLMYGVPPHPSVLADEKGRMDVVLHAKDGKALENQFRKVVVEMGCTGGVIIGSLTPEQALTTLVPHSYSRAWNIGNAVLAARANKACPIAAILKEESGKKMFAGKIYDVRRETTGGFNRGDVSIEGTDEFLGWFARVEVQNENLIIKTGNNKDVANMRNQACVPDLISIVDNETGEPIPSENVRYGQRVSVLVLPSHALLRTETALRYVGPKAFGYSADVQFVPLEESDTVESIANRI